MAKIQVRYIVYDMDAAITFYTGQLGFKLEINLSNNGRGIYIRKNIR
jgi:catechol 2,3-dioxygenase-like lactoylglutathione lyase family enzyme